MSVNNLPQAILGAGVGCYRDSVHMKAISDGLKGELEAIAHAKGIDLSKTEASPGVEVQYRHLRVILLCRIWMQEDTQRLICFQVH